MKISSTLRRIAPLIVPLLCVSMALPTSGRAATVFWDLNGFTDGSGGPAPTGTWDGSVQWNTEADGTGLLKSWTAGDIAVFSAGSDATDPYTITVGGGGQTIRGLNFRSGDVTLGGAGLTLAANSSIAVGTGLNATVNSVIGGGFGLAKIGAGTLTLGGVNTFSGPVSLRNGILSISSAGALGDGSATNLLQMGGGTLQTAGTFSLGANRKIFMGLGGGTLDVTSGTLTVDGVVNMAGGFAVGGFTGAGVLTKNGAGTLVLSGTNNVASVTPVGSPLFGTTVNQGTLSIGTSANLGTSRLMLGGGTTLLVTGSSSTFAGLTTLMGSGATINVATAGQTFTGSGVMFGAGGLSKAGNGVLAISAAALYGGATNVTAGTLQGGVASYLPAVTALTVSTGATVNMNNFATTISSLGGAGILANTGTTTTTLTLGNQGGSVNSTFSGVFNGAAGTPGSLAVLKNGGGILTINSNAPGTATGAWTLAGGTVKLDFGTSTATTNILSAATPLTLNGGILNVNGRAGATVTQQLGNVTLNAGGSQVLMTANGGTSTTLTLGTVPVSGGTGTTAGGSLLITRPTGTTVRITTTNVTNSTYGGRIVFSDGAGNFNWASNGGGSSPYTVTGLGTYTNLVATGGSTSVNYQLNGTLTQTGAVVGNSLKINTTAAGQSLNLGANNLTLTNGGLLFVGANDYTISGTTGQLRSGTGSNADLIVHQYGAGVLTINSIIGTGTGTSTFTKTGTGKVVLGGANVFTGGVFLNGGTLSISNNNQLGATATSAVTISDGATFQTTADVNTGTHTYSLLGGTANFDMASSSTLTIGGSPNSISGAGGLRVVSGTLNLGVLANYSGPTFVNSGATFRGGINNTTGGTLNVAAGGQVDLGAFAMTIGGLEGDGAVYNGGGAAVNLAFGGNNLSTTFSGVLQGTSTGALPDRLNVVKNGSGTTTLMGVNNYTGVTTVTNGVLRVGVQGAVPAVTSTGSSLNISPSVAGATAVMDFNGFNHSTPITSTAAATHITFAASGANSQATLNMGAGGVLTLGNNVVVSGTTHAGVFITGGSIVMPSYTISNVNNVNRTFNVADSTNAAVDLTITSDISSSGSLAVNFTKDGAGLLLLTGNNTYTGATIVTAGTLAVAGQGTLGSGVNPLTLNANLDLNGTNQTVGLMTGTGTGANVFNNAPGTLSILTMGNGTEVANVGSYAGSLRDGAGILGVTKTGNSTITLTGPSTFTGPLRPQQGNLVVRNTMDTGILDLSVLGGILTLDTGAVMPNITSSQVIEAGTLVLNTSLATALPNVSQLNILNGSVITTSPTAIPNGFDVNFQGGDGLLQVANGSNVELDFISSTQSGVLAFTTGPADSNLIINDPGAGPFNFSGSIGMRGAPGTGAGNVIKNTATEWILSGGSSYVGNTVLNAGSITRPVNSPTEVLPDQSVIVMAAGTSINFNGQSETVGSLSGPAGSTINIGAGTLSFARNGVDTTYGGSIIGTSAAGLVKENDGKLTLTGSTTLGTGGTVSIEGGILELARAGGSTLNSEARVHITGAGTTLSVLSNQTLAGLTGTRNSILNIGPGATLSGSYVPAPDIVLKAKANTSTRVMQVMGGTNNLAVGMTVDGVGTRPGVTYYIVQILSQDQVLLNDSFQLNTPAGNNTDYTFSSASLVGSIFKGSGTWEKNGTGTVILTGGGADFTGTMKINDGLVRAGGVNVGARNIIQDAISNNATVEFGSTGNPTLTLAANIMNLQPYERIGALSGGGPGAVVELTGSASVGLLALGGNNATTSYTGSIRGSAGAQLVKDGTGTFTWTNNDVSVLDGTIFMDQGGFVIQGNQGLSSSGILSLSNNQNVNFTFNTSVDEVIGALAGGGRGATRLFSNGTTPGAVAGAYLTGGSGNIIISAPSLTVRSTQANAVFISGANIGGTGRFIKEGNNVLDLRGINTNTGDTIVRTVDADANTITNTLRIGYYGAASGVGVPSGEGGFGVLSPASNLKMTLANTGTNKNVVFDLASSTQTVNALMAEGVGTGNKTFIMGGGTLNVFTTRLNGSGPLSDIGFFDGAFTGRGTINVGADIATTSWNLLGNNNALLGSFNVQSGGKVSLGRFLGTLGDTMALTVAGAGAGSPAGVLTVNQADMVGSLSGAGSVVLNFVSGIDPLAPSLVLTQGPRDSTFTNSWTGNISGAGGLRLENRASMRMQANQSYTGSTTLAGSSILFLDYSQGATDILKGGTALVPGLVLRGGSIFLSGNNATGGTGYDKVNFTSLASGSTTVAAVRDDNSRFGFGTITRGTGGVLQVKGTSANTSNASNTIGTLGGYATFGNGDLVTTWAVPNAGDLAISGLLDASFNATTINGFGTPDSAWGNNKHTDVKSNNFAVTGNTGSLRFNTPEQFGGEIQLILGGASGVETHVIQSGGILVTQNVGASDIRLTDFFTGATITGGAGANYGVTNDLIIHQHNPLGSFILELPVGDNNGSTGFTKAGKGRVILARNNGYSGQTSILDGVLQLGEGGNEGDLGSLIGGELINNGWLDIKRSDTSLDIQSDITGAGSVVVDSSGGSVLIRGSNSTYTGTTYVLGGKLISSSTSNGLGSADGLTSVATNGTLEFNTLASSEPIYLRGGTLATTSGGATINGQITIGANSDFRAGGASNLTLASTIVTAPGAVLTLNGAGRHIITNSGNVIEQIVINTGAILQIGNNTAGSVSITPIQFSNSPGNDSKVVINVNDGQYVFGAPVSGTGGLRILRNTVWLAGDNTYSGETIIGGNLGSVGGNIGEANQAAELRVGNETYQGTLGTGPVIVQASSAGQSTLRFQQSLNTTITNQITLNPWTDGTTNPRSALLIRQNAGSLTISGHIIAGQHNVGPGVVPGTPFTQRALIQSDIGGKLIFNGTIANGLDNRLNFQTVNNSWIEFANKADGTFNNLTLFGQLLGTALASPGVAAAGSNTSGGTYIFRNNGTITLNGANNFLVGTPQANNQFQNVIIQRGTLIVNNALDTSLATPVPNGLADDADIYINRGAKLRFNFSETAGYFATQQGSLIELASGVRLTIDDGSNYIQNANTALGAQVLNSDISGNGGLTFSATVAGNWFSLTSANSSFTGLPIIGGPSFATAVRVSHLGNAGQNSSLGTSAVIQLGSRGSVQTAGLEIMGNTAGSNVTNRTFNLSGSGAVATRTSVGNPGATTTVKVNDANGVAIGMFLTAPGVPPGTQVLDVDLVNNEVTISNPAVIAAATQLEFETSTNSIARISSVGRLPVTLNGDISITNLSNKTMQFGGATVGNVFNGRFDQGNAVMSVVVNPNVANTEAFAGGGTWKWTNPNSNFSGNLTINQGALELAGNLGDGTGTTSIIGNLDATRTIDLGINNYDGRRYDIIGNADGIGAGAAPQSTTVQLFNTGTLIFNDPNAGTFTLGSNITFTQSFSSTTAPGSGELVNNGVKRIVINGNLTAGASGNRVWFLDGTNTEINTIAGVISGANVGVTKEGTGTWRLSGNNTFTGALTVNRGVLQISGGNALNNATTTVNLADNGSDGSSLGTHATLQVMTSETVTSIASAATRSNLILDTGANLTLTGGGTTFAGIISGGGGLIKTATSAGTIILPNKSSYTGVTQMNSGGTAGANAAGFQVTHLADIGQDSGIGRGDATSQASNQASLVFNNGGNAGGGLIWTGFTSQSTNRLFTLGATTLTTDFAGVITSNGTLIGTNAPGLTFSNPGPIAHLTANTNSALLLTGTSLGENTFSPQLTNNGTGTTRLAKTGAGVWVLTNGANSYSGTTTITAGTLAITAGGALGTSAVTINGGAGVGLQLRDAGAVANNVTISTAEGGINAKSGTSTMNGLLSLSANGRISVDTGAALALTNSTLSVTGTGQVFKAGGGTLTMSGVNDYTGQTIVSGGVLNLDYSTNNTSKLADLSPLIVGWSGTSFVGLGSHDVVTGQTNQYGMTGGTIMLTGGSHTEAVQQTTLGAGANYIVRAPGSTARIDLGNINRGNGAGATIDFSEAGIAITNNINGTSTGILNTSGGTGTVVGAFATVGKSFWATTANTGSGHTVTALALLPASNNNFAANVNTNVVSFAAPAAAATTGTLRFAEAGGGTLTLNGLLSLNSAGLLMTPTSGNVTITGFGIRNAATTAALESLIIHQHSASSLQIDSILQNNSGAQGLMKAGTGKVYLNAINTITGAINLHEGEIQVGGTILAPTTPTDAKLAGVNAPLNLSQGAVLRFLSTNATAQDFGALQGGGTIILDTGNTMMVRLDTESANFNGDIVVNGGTLQVASTITTAATVNVLGNTRGTTTINAGTLLLDISAATVVPTFSELITYNQGSTFATVASAQIPVFNGKQTLGNNTPDGMTFNLPSGSTVNITGVIFGQNGFTKAGNGILQVGANNFMDVVEGTTAANKTATLNGNIIVAGGELRVGGARALGGSGFANRVTVQSGASLDLNAQSLAYVDDPDPFRKFIEISGEGFNSAAQPGFGSGALRSGASGTATFSHLVMGDDAVINGGGFLNGAAPRIDLAGYDTDAGTGSSLSGNFTRVNPTITGDGKTLTIRGSNAVVGAGVVLHQPQFTSFGGRAAALGALLVREGNLRLEADIQLPGQAAWAGLSSADITGGLEIGYGGPSLADVRNGTLGLGPVVGARLTLYRNMNTHHTVKLTMNGLLAQQNGGYNYIDVSSDTAAQLVTTGTQNALQIGTRTYLDGGIELLGSPARMGDFDRNIIHNDFTVSNATIMEEGNMTGTIQAKLIIGSVISGAGGFTKTGTRELRLTNTNTFTGAVSVLRHGTTSARWQSNTVSLNGVDYETLGDAEGWAEWGLTLAGANGTLSNTSDVILQRKGMITLDNTNRLDASNNYGGALVAGGNNNNRINDAADIFMENGWLRIMGGTTANSESLATAGGAKMYLEGGSNLIELWPSDGLNQTMTLTIGQIERSSGSVLTISNLDATSTFGSATPSGSVDSVRVALTNMGNLEMVGSTPGVTQVIPGLLGGIIPHGYLQDIHEINYQQQSVVGSLNVQDYLNQGRFQQWMAGSHFMTREGGFLRPLDDSEYFTPSNGVVSSSPEGGAGKNLNLVDMFSIMKENTTVNSLRFGPVADSKGNNTGNLGAINNGTTLTSYASPHSIGFNIDGTLTVESGMVSSAFFSVGTLPITNTSGNANAPAAVVIRGGTINFGAREGIINNQNGYMYLPTGSTNLFFNGTPMSSVANMAISANFELQTNIAGSGGLTKTGFAQVTLDGQNTYTGVTSVTNGTLILRNGRHALGAGGAGNGVVVMGSGTLQANNGIQIGTPEAREDIYVGVMQAANAILQGAADTTNYFGNITVDNVDAAGQVVFNPLLLVGGNSTLIINGNIFGGSTAISQDVNAVDSRLLTTAGSGAGYMIIRGQIGDRGDLNGNAVPINHASTGLPTTGKLGTLATGSTTTGGNLIINENEAFRFQINTANINVLMEQQYNAAGRLSLDAGFLLVDYDPALLPVNDNGFFTEAALSANAGQQTDGSMAVNGSSTHGGFQIGSSSTAGLFLTKPGQIFNMGSWRVQGTANAAWVGGLNETGTVQIGSNTTSGTLNLEKATSFYAAGGGTVQLNMRLSGGTFVKNGLGTVVIGNTFLNPAASDTHTFDLGGGTVIVDHNNGSATTPGRLGASGNFTFRGGSFIVQANSAATAAATVNYAQNNAAVRTLAFTAGGTEMVAESRSASAFTLNFGNNEASNSDPTNNTRSIGATVNFVELMSGTGAANIVIQSNNAAAAIQKNRIVSFATYGTQRRSALDFAYLDNASGINIYPRLASEYLNDVTQWAAGQNISDFGGGFINTVTGTKTINTLRFDTAVEDSVIIAPGAGLRLTGDNLAGGILISSNTGSVNKFIKGGAGSTLSISGTGTDLIFHQYGLGTLGVETVISGSMGVTISGPSSTARGTENSTGIVRLSGGNTFTGIVSIVGAVLELNDMTALGTATGNTAITMNGGTLRWTGGQATLGNKGITVQGNGAIIDVVKPESLFIIGQNLGSTNAFDGEAAFRGDLIKRGAGTLVMQGTNTANGVFEGLIDIREGSLLMMVDTGAANATTTTVLGTNNSWADGTIFRDGTNVQAFFGNGDNGGDWNIEEYITFEGNNTFTYSGIMELNANVSGTALDGILNLGNRRPLNLIGSIKIDGTVTFDVGGTTANVQGSVLRLANSNGYVTGSGDIVKDGLGQLEFRSNTPDWTGNLIIRQGNVIASNQGDVLGTGYKTGKKITLGDTDRQAMASLFLQNPDSIANWKFEINHDIEVVYNPAQTKRLGMFLSTNGVDAAYNGNITLNDNLNILMTDNNPAFGGEQNVLKFNGRFQDGALTSGNLVIQGADIDIVNAGTGGANDNVSGRIVSYALFNNDNSLWTGDVVLSTNLTYDHDKTTVLRFGHNQALTAANEVTMNFNSIIQAGGMNVTMGSLTTLGGNGAFNGTGGTMNASTNGSSEIIENAAVAEGTININQSTPVTIEAVWDAKFRNGTLNSQFLAPGSNTHLNAGALHLTKSGPGWATLTLENEYTGKTRVTEGILQVGRGNIGDTGANNAEGTWVMTPGPGKISKLAGTGWVMGRLEVQNGALLAPGDFAGDNIGTLNINGNAVFASGSNMLLQVRNPTYNNPGVVDASTGLSGLLNDAYVAWRDNLLTDAYSHALNDVVTPNQHDMINVINGTINWSPGTKITLVNDGYTPKAGDVFHLFKAAPGSFTGTLTNTGANIRVGNETGLDVTLFPLGGNFLWDLSQLVTRGIALVVTRETASTQILPEFKTSPISNPVTPPALAPETPVTVSVTMKANPLPATYQWYATNEKGTFTIIGASGSLTPNIAEDAVVSATFNVTSQYKGEIKVIVTNEAGPATSVPVNVLVNDTPSIPPGPWTPTGTGGQPVSTSVNPGASVTFNARVAGTGPFTYQWRKNGVDIPGATAVIPNETGTISYTIPSVVQADEGDYRVFISNAGGDTLSNAATLTVNDPVTNVVVTTNPVGPNFYLGDNVTFSSTFQGTAQGVTRQWFRRPIAGGAAVAVPGVGNVASFPLNNLKAGSFDAATPGSEGIYYVVVNNITGGAPATSNEITISVKPSAPQILSHTLANKTILSGQPLEFSVTAIGKPALKYTWKRNGVAVAGYPTNLSTFSVPQAAVANGGTYTFEVSNATLPKATPTGPSQAEVVVVDSSTKVVKLGVNATATFTALVGVGPKTLGVSYKWFKLLPGDVKDEITTAAYGSRYTGFATKALKITKTVAGDDGVYVCEVTGPDQVTVTGATHDLRIFTDRPVINNPQTLPNGVVGGVYNYQITYDEARSKTPATFAAAPLPAGLKLDPVTGRITGKPTKAGTSQVKISATNGAGKSLDIPVAPLTVIDLHQGIAGVYAGTVARNASLNAGLGGRIDLTVTGTATMTGKLIMGTDTFTFPAGSALNVDLDGNVPASAILTLPRKAPLGPLILSFKINRFTGYLTDASVTDGSVVNGSVVSGPNTADITGWRYNWNATSNLASKYIGIYNVALALPDNDPLVGNPTVPQGSGYASFTVAKDGKLTLAGKTPDGENLTGGAWLGPNGEIVMFQTMYTPKGSVLGSLAVGKGLNDADPVDNVTTGGITWIRPASTVASARLYKAGFGSVAAPVYLGAAGGFYEIPVAPKVLLGLTNTTTPFNALVLFEQGGVDTDVPNGTDVFMNPDLAVTIGAASKITVPVKSQLPQPNGTNQAALRLSAVDKKGTFTGGFTLGGDTNPRTTPPVAPPVVSRTVTYQGLICKINGEYVGVGYFLLAQLPSNAKTTPINLPVATTPTTSPILSGLVTLEKNQ